MSTAQRPHDDSWPMIEEAVFRLFDDMAGGAEYVTVGTALADLGWSHIEAEYHSAATELLFRAQGRSLAQTDCLDRVMLAELAGLIGGEADRILLPGSNPGYTPESGSGRVSGIVLGPLEGRVAIPVGEPAGTVSIGVVDASALKGIRLETFDTSAFWTLVSGPLDGILVEASTEWNNALAAAHRALATELVALAERALLIAVEHVGVRVQFGAPIGSFQSPRHALADASATLEGARALLGEAWRDPEQFSAATAKAAAGRAHQAVSNAALQVCGAIGLTAEHDLHRYVTRGFLVDALCGPADQLEALIAEHLFDGYAPGRALPAVVSWSE